MRFSRFRARIPRLLRQRHSFRTSSWANDLLKPIATSSASEVTTPSGVDGPSFGFAGARTTSR